MMAEMSSISENKFTQSFPINFVWLGYLEASIIWITILHVQNDLYHCCAMMSYDDDSIPIYR